MEKREKGERGRRKEESGTRVMEKRDWGEKRQKKRKRKGENERPGGERDKESHGRRKKEGDG